ncbi:MAG TPA: hypothetical protein VGG84_04395 [Gemmatimonadaceae bacterium]
MVQSLLLFVHVASAMGIVAALGIEGLVLLQLGRARLVEEVRSAMGSFRYVQRVGAASLIATVLSGIYLATVYWRWEGPWIGTAFILLIANAVVGAVMSGRNQAAIGRATAAQGSGRSPDVERSKATLRASFVIRAALILGIVFLMTVKPGSDLSLLVAAVAVLLGLTLGLWALRGRGERLEQAK